MSGFIRVHPSGQRWAGAARKTSLKQHAFASASRSRTVGFRLLTLDWFLPLPCLDDPFDQRVQLRLEILLVGILAQPVHGLTNAQAEGHATTELGDEALDLRSVEHAGMGLVAFEGAGHLRRYLADEVGRDLHDARGSHPHSRGDVGIDLVPREHLVAGDGTSRQWP